jgi:hypothetical protein
MVSSTFGGTAVAPEAPLMSLDLSLGPFPLMTTLKFCMRMKLLYCSKQQKKIQMYNKYIFEK